MNTFMQKVRRWRTTRETVVALERLSNRELADLGINRTNIRAVAQSVR